jgi:hypothetical protein
MHATRIVTFLLGGWIFCLFAVDTAVYLNLRLPDRVMANPPPEAVKIYNDYGPREAALLLRYFAAEGNRYFLGRWERTEILLGLVLIPFLFVATDRKLVPSLLACFMLMITLFQYFALTPELAFRGRETDFPPGRGDFKTEQRVWLLQEVYTGTEAVMVLVGGILTLYVASYKSRRRVRAGDDPTLLDEVVRRRV